MHRDRRSSSPVLPMKESAVVPECATSPLRRSRAKQASSWTAAGPQPMVFPVGHLSRVSQGVASVDNVEEQLKVERLVAHLLPYGATKEGTSDVTVGRQ